MTALLVLLGGAVGAALRYLVDLRVRARVGARIPWGTFCVNVIGSAVLGAVLGGTAHLGWSQSAVTLLGTGVCGAFTTFSTYSLEGANLLREARSAAALAYLLGSLAVGLAAFSLAWWLTTL